MTLVQPFEVADLAAMHPADAVEALNDMEAEKGAALLAAMDFRSAVNILEQAGLENGAALVGEIPRAKAAPLLAEIAADRRAEIFRKMEREEARRLLALLPDHARVEMEQLLTYEPDTAGGLMTTEFFRALPEWTVAQSLEAIRTSAATLETVYAAYVVDADGALIRAVSLRELVTADPQTPILSVGSYRKPLFVHPDDPREKVARLISKYDLSAAPVIDASGKILGIVTNDDIIDAIIDDDTEDAQKQGGMEALDAPYMATSFWRMIKKRAGWLSALFLAEMLTASAMQHFESELERAVVLTLFIPLIMSSGGNSGSQATSLIIRALALEEIRLRDWWRVALRELPSGVALGAILGAVGFVRIVLWQKLGVYDYGEHWVLVGFTVSAALVGIVTFGSLTGSMLPFAIQKLGFDPASASAPFVATLVDVTGLVIYFSIALVILRGTLL
ncbi:magnesium transporter [Rhodoblastus acidophilus]|uniref:Magnesium transporter MgtE n=1 Tax=Candidatus Rhodoblastus alkanivorans TaxID=2954117 RepID=A0ABS9Z4M0_9HYPH|nr:magnesium transporter [Candidatus Rhodoblastus alkanivorans]MCI4680718.1 magnesium transporter [Candidatus Rhodoblastus alkanivorans]MCI4682325.1 magnesium transporter [Candidatus Rhodoblastus alkanivorans]MDI4639627.1 magnesium transporter [Rhodoblastus acidophilus]